MVDAIMTDETQKALLTTIPMGRPGETNDMAGLVLFLASKVCQTHLRLFSAVTSFSVAGRLVHRWWCPYHRWRQASEHAFDYMTRNLDALAYVHYYLPGLPRRNCLQFYEMKTFTRGRQLRALNGSNDMLRCDPINPS